MPESRYKRKTFLEALLRASSLAHAAIPITYAASAVSLLRGTDPPENWEEQARARFLEGYVDTVDPSLLPAGHAAIDRLLSVFELEKAVYELQYELDNRPEWVGIPVRGIQRLLEETNTPA